MGVLIRILLRYIAAALVAKGMLSPGLGDMLALDPDVSAVIEILAGGMAALVAELSYVVAKRLGWRT